MSLVFNIFFLWQFEVDIDTFLWQDDFGFAGGLDFDTLTGGFQVPEGRTDVVSILFSHYQFTKMPKAKNGVLIEIDVATKIYLTQLPDYENFKLMDIDDRHLFIKEDQFEYVKSKVTMFKEESTRVKDRGE